MSNDWHSDRQDTLRHALARVVETAPDRIFLDFSGALTSYGEFDRLATRQAHALAALGVRAGETVVTMLDNNLDAVVAWFATNKLGAISVPLNTALKGEFLRHQAEDSQAALMIVEADYLPRLGAIAPSLTRLTRILRRGEPSEPVPDFGLPVEPLDAHRGSDETPIPIAARPGDISCIIYTSGTTGPSKGSMQPYNFFCNLARARLASCPATEADITFSPMPLFHNNALATGIAGTVISGGRIVIAPRFSVSAFWPEIERSGATIVSLVGSMATLIAEAPDSEASRRCYGRVHTVRGVPFPDRVKEAWRTRFGAKFVGSNDYGMTEAAVLTWLPGGAWAPPNSSGQRYADFDVRIFDEDDHEVPMGETGEIVVRPMKPDIMFKGYWRRPEATVAVMRNQWFHTGDIGRFDADGFLYFVDRKKDYLKRRGENISSFEMEVALKAHPAILEVAVHAVASDLGDDVKVTAVLRPGATLTERDYCLWIAERVPYFAVPRYVEFRPALPKNPQDKVLKYLLRDEGRTPATWDLEASDIRIARR
ncbi:MAG TPA: AMP-binding protein [Paracoccaceae bacterium]|nr:AMP-binding protein [Paracoccaceae bacterium]